VEFTRVSFDMGKQHALENRRLTGHQFLIYAFAEALHVGCVDEKFAAKSGVRREDGTCQH
jgi:hypothetical protein